MDSLINTGQDYCDSPKQCIQPSVLETMKSKKLRLEQQLNAVNECIEGLEAHPEVTKVLELINKAR